MKVLNNIEKMYMKKLVNRWKDVHVYKNVQKKTWKNWMSLVEVQIHELLATVTHKGFFKLVLIVLSTFSFY